jgi:DNA-binding response OmpR family regulator
MRILVISENPSERDRAVSALALIDGAAVDEASSARHASDLARGARYDVLVVDGDLAPKGGFSWLYELNMAADLDGTTAPPAIVMTARPQDDWLADWARAREVLRKPVDSFVLADRVRQLGAPTPATA